MTLKILILGVTGMLGYNSYKILKEKKYKVYGTSKSDLIDDKNIFVFSHSIENINNIIDKLNPDIVLNCIAILRENDYNQKNDMIYSNCTIPLNLSNFCKNKNIYLIHFSTDAVFKSSETFNSINESYSPDSFYGLTKAISESILDDSLVLRICPIGFDKFKRKSLFNFIYDNENSEINGYKNAFFNGTTTIVIINEIIKIIENKKYIYGIRHITGPKISKFDLLNIINKEYNLNKKIKPIYEPKISRLLKDDLIDSKLLDWNKMIQDLKLLFD